MRRDEPARRRITRRRTGAAVVASVALLALGACGGGGSAKASPATVAPTTTSVTGAPASQPVAPTALNACALATQPQAETLIGTKLLAGVRTTNADTDSCTYAGDPNGPTAQVELFVGAGAKKFYDDDHDVLQKQFSDVAGLGDESHEEDYAIFFRKGTTWAALRLTSLDDWTTFKDRAETLAKNIAVQM